MRKDELSRGAGGGGIANLFEARVDGMVAEAEHLGSKPARDTYLRAARLGQVDALHGRGADAVVSDLAELLG